LNKKELPRRSVTVNDTEFVKMDCTNYL